MEINDNCIQGYKSGIIKPYSSEDLKIRGKGFLIAAVSTVAPSNFYIQHQSGPFLKE